MINFKRVLSVVFAMALIVSSFGLCAVNAVETKSANATSTTYSLPTDDASFSAYAATSGYVVNGFTGAGAPFKLGGINLGSGTTLDANQANFGHITTTARETTWNTAGINVWGQLIFQQGENFSSKGFSTNAFTMMYKYKNASEKWVSTISFVAPEAGIYMLDVSFARRTNYEGVGTDYLLVKNKDLTNGVLDSYSWEYDEEMGNNVAFTSAANQTLTATVTLAAGEEVWFIAAPKDPTNSNQNQTIVNSFTATYTGAPKENPEFTDATYSEFGLSLYLTLPEDTTGYTVNATVNGAPVDVALEEIMFFSTTPKEIFDTVKVEISDASGVVATYEGGVAAEAKKIVDDAEASAEEKALAQATLNLGAIAKEYFNHEGGTVVGATTPTGPATTLTGATASGDAVEGISYELFNVRADDTFYLRHHFYVTDTNCTVSVDGQPVSLNQSNDNENYYWVEVQVAAGEFANPQTITITDGTNTQTITVSIYSYIAAVLADAEGNADLVDVANALYDYNEAYATAWGGK